MKLSRDTKEDLKFIFGIPIIMFLMVVAIGFAVIVVAKVAELLGFGNLV